MVTENKMADMVMKYTMHNLDRKDLELIYKALMNYNVSVTTETLRRDMLVAGLKKELDNDGRE